MNSNNEAILEDQLVEASVDDLPRKVTHLVVKSVGKLVFVFFLQSDVSKSAPYVDLSVSPHHFPDHPPSLDRVTLFEKLEKGANTTIFKIHPKQQLALNVSC
jgi:hypothetical protein